MISSDSTMTRSMGLSGPLSSEIQKKMEPLMGVLSNFIVDRAFKRCCLDTDEISNDDIDQLVEIIVEESKLLLGPKRSEELSEELKEITKDYYQEEE